MANLRVIRNALGDRLASINGLTVHRRVPDYSQLNVPCVVIGPQRTEPEQTFGRGDLSRYEFDITVMVKGAQGRDAAQDALDTYTATSSTGGIFGAIAADRTLGGVVDHTFVKSMSDYGDIEVTQDVMHLGCTYLVECWST